MSDDVYDLARFFKAQEGTYHRALAEIRRGRKDSHWMWFIFPQLGGLGRSPVSQLYAIKSVDEAKAYLAHPLLGTRLLECTEAVLAIAGRSAEEIFGTPDDFKLRSCATLFAAVSPPDSVFHRIIDKYFAGESDSVTQALLRDAPADSRFTQSPRACDAAPAPRETRAR
jgi:uncharacterized protein (DUF1810 family)